MSNKMTAAESRAESLGLIHMQGARLELIERDARDRFDRLETKLDEMSLAIISLARAEEKISTLTSFSKQQSEQVLNLINRMDRLEEMVNKNASTVHIINKLFWIILTAGAAAIAGMLFIQ